MRDEYAPEIVKFDPVTDRDKIDIVEEQASYNNNFLNRLFICFTRQICNAVIQSSTSKSIYTKLLFKYGSWTGCKKAAN